MGLLKKLVLSLFEGSASRVPNFRRASFAEVARKAESGFAQESLFRISIFVFRVYATYLE